MSPRHRALRQRSLVATVLLVLVSTLALTFTSLGASSSASAATPVSKASCKRYDPNLVNGMCLRYQAGSGTAFTWIGSYRAANGRVFFCIDYLYDSRIAGRPTIISTRALVNQFGSHVGAGEVAALNQLISTWAAHGSTGSNSRDAAIALIIREVMSDGVRTDGTVIYPRRLRVDEPVRPPAGGMPGPILALARAMWTQASHERGPWRLLLAATQTGPLELGRSRSYRVLVLSAAGRAVPGVRVAFGCSGPIPCPKPLTTSGVPIAVAVTPSAVGPYSIRATVTGPAADGTLYRVGSWRTHGGSTARSNGVQRGWIAQSTSATVAVSATSVIIKGTPVVTTKSSTGTAFPGMPLRDVVTISSLPTGYHQSATATLYGPYDAQPEATSCTHDHQVGQVSFPVSTNGTLTTSPITVHGPGYYVWTETLPGDDHTNPVTTACGIREETTLVRAAPSAPTVHTVASAQRILVGGPVHDTVTISGLAPGASVPVQWTLLGPIAPRRGSCAHLDWRTAPQLATGSFTATHNGSWTTSGTVLHTSGCVTYVERLSGTDASLAVHTPAGVPVETVLVTRPATRFVPEIPSGPYSAGA